MARVREEGLEDRILDSAFVTFGERGFLATTIKEIASGAGISSGTIYTYFPDKEAVFRAAVTRGWENFIAELERLAVGSDQRQERIDSLLSKGFEALGNALPLIRGMFFDASRLNLIEPYLERVCAGIDRLLAPEPRHRLASGWEAAAPRRLLVIRVLILGVLSSAALANQVFPGDMVRRLREATNELLRQTGMDDLSISYGEMA
jgi:AcrR family transcriptional regulator